MYNSSQLTAHSSQLTRTLLNFSKRFVLLALLLAFAAPGWAADGDVSYIYYEPAPDGMSATKHTDGVKHNNEYNVVTSSTNEWGAGWYVVPAGTVTISPRIHVSGTVNLILCDGATLNAQNGIKVEDSGVDPNTNILNIYGQTAGTGQLVAKGDSSSGSAGIGGINEDGVRNGGTVTIHGGVVTATGSEGGAGIGGGQGGNGYAVKIYGGTVTATGSVGTNGKFGAGIGHGQGGRTHGSLMIGTGVAVYGGENAEPSVLLTPSKGVIGITKSDRPQYMKSKSFVPVTEVKLNNIELTVDETKTLTATLIPDKAENKSVTWMSDNTNVAAVNDGKVTGVSVGTTTITATATNGMEAEFYHVSATCTVTVNKGTPTVTAPTANKLTYNGSAQPLVEGGSTSGGTLVYLLDGKTYSDKIPTGKDAGEYTVYYKVDGGDNYNDVAAQTVSVTIDKAAATVTADDKSKTSGETDPTLTATVTGLVTGESANLINYTLTRAAGEAVGKFAITASGAAEQGNYAVTFVPGTLTINAKSGGETGGSTVTPDPVKPDGNNSGNGTGNGNNGNGNGGSESGNNNGESGNGTDNGNTDNGNGKDSGNGESGKTDSLTEEQKSAVEEAKQEQKQETEQKAQEAEEVAKTVDDSTDGGKSLADLMSGKNTDVSKSKEETQAAALEVKEEIEKSGLDVSEMSAYEVKKAVENTAQAREDKVDEAAGNVKDPTVPAAANMNSSDDITIKPAPVNVVEQAKAVEELIRKVIETLRDQNEVLASALPEMTAQEDGFYLLNINLRHLLPGQELQLRLSAEDYNGQQTAGKVSVSLAAAGKEGDHFFLDENDVPTKVVRGDASKMKVVAYLKGNKTYNAFITVAATEADKTELETLATELNSGSNDSPTSDAPISDKGSGGCDAGFGGLALLALLGLIARKRK